jgi:hypothetical protein
MLTAARRRSGHALPAAGARADAVIAGREGELLARVRAAYPDVYYEHCTRELLGDLAVRHGIDFATTLFYDRIRRAPQNRALVDALDGAGSAPAIGRARGRVLIVPALFYRERPEIGGDGAVVQRAALEAGLDVDVLPTPSAGTAHENAAVLRTMLPDYVTESTVVVSLSKGAADTRLALESMPSLPRGLRAWVIVSGLVHGTPAIDWMLARWWRRLALRYLLARGGAPPALAEEFTTQSSLSRRASAPAGLPVFNLIGCPLSHHLTTRFGRMRHQQMAHLGPNDGLTLLRDAIVEPGLVYPVWGTDHYFRTPGVPELMRRLITFLFSGQLSAVSHQLRADS